MNLRNADLDSILFKLPSTSGGLYTGQAFPPGYPVTRVFLVSRLKFAILSRTIEVPASLSSFFPTPAFSRY